MAPGGWEISWPSSRRLKTQTFGQTRQFQYPALSALPTLMPPAANGRNPPIVPKCAWCSIRAASLSHQGQLPARSRPSPLSLMPQCSFRIPVIHVPRSILHCQMTALRGKPTFQFLSDDRWGQSDVLLTCSRRPVPPRRILARRL